MRALGWIDLDVPHGDDEGRYPWCNAMVGCVGGLKNCGHSKVGRGIGCDVALADAQSVPSGHGKACWEGGLFNKLKHILSGEGLASKRWRL